MPKRILFSEIAKTKLFAGIGFGFIAFCLANAIACTASEAVEVTVNFSGIVDHASGPGAKQFRKGELVTGSYKLDTSVLDLAPADPNKGQYRNGLIATTINFPDSGQTFSHEWGPGLFADVSVSKNLKFSSVSRDDVNISAWHRKGGTLLDGIAPCCVEIGFSASTNPDQIPQMLVNDSIPMHPLAYTYANLHLGSSAGWTDVFIKPVLSPDSKNATASPEVALLPADEVTVEFSGIVESATGPHANRFRKGELATGTYKLNKAVANHGSRDPTIAVYNNAFIGATVSFPGSGLTFSQGFGGADYNAVTVQKSSRKWKYYEFGEHVSMTGGHRTGGSLLGGEAPCCLSLSFSTPTPRDDIDSMLANVAIPTKRLAFAMIKINLKTSGGYTEIALRPGSVAKPGAAFGFRSWIEEFLGIGSK
ncbi:MAG: hypothetical protein A3I66_04965 [Burkholderiales bacterium RIFCSPLOWO2_02_FULL_57_36]|nr:MAG: hypothetical protein A3I66_04965 [Burkholderiales bacterium RIFCSPLOWO2_02_FULL_57_36]